MKRAQRTVGRADFRDPTSRHGVTADSISGVPYQISPDCDSCRLYLGRNTVDSMRLGNMAKGALKSIGFASALMAAAAIVLIQTVDTD